MVEVQRGTLAQLSLPALLAQLFASRHTGAVQLRYGGPGDPSRPTDAEAEELDKSRVQIFFRGGYPVDVLDPGSSDRLGVVLLELGLLDRDRFLRAQALRPTAGKLIGEQMLEGRLLDRRSVREGLRAQVRRRLNVLFFREESAAARYQIFSGSHARGMGDGESLASDPRRIIYFGVRRAYALERLQEGIAALRGLDVQLLPEGAEAARWLPPSEQRLPQILLRGAWSVDHLLSGGQVHPQAVLAFLYTYTLTHGLIIKTASSAQRRMAASASAVRALPYQASDEPLAASEAPATTLGRPVFLRGGGPAMDAVPGAAARPRAVVLVALEAPLPDPAAAPSLASSAAVAPPSPTTPDLKTWTAPPLRTSLPSQRLATAVSPVTPAPRPKPDDEP